MVDAPEYLPLLQDAVVERLSTRRRSIALTAAGAPVRRCAARCTSANEPFPTNPCSLYSPTSSLSSSSIAESQSSARRGGE